MRTGAMSSRFFLSAVFATTLCIGLGTNALAAPSISKLNLRGLQSGGTTTLVIDGADLLPSPRLVSSLPMVSQVLKKGATASKVQIDVTLDAKSDAGLYNLWLVTEKGVSQRQIIAVDFLPQKPFAAKVDELPVALHGNFTGSRSLETTFSGKAGQKVIIEVESVRLGSKEQPVIHLLDSGEREIGLALPTFALRGD